MTWRIRSRRTHDLNLVLAVVHSIDQLGPTHEGRTLGLRATGEIWTHDRLVIAFSALTRQVLYQAELPWHVPAQIEGCFMSFVPRHIPS